MTRIIEHSQDSSTDEEVFELRVFQLKGGDPSPCTRAGTSRSVGVGKKRATSRGSRQASRA